MRNKRSLLTLLLFVAALFAALPITAAAQDDPPSRVARLNYIQGSVSYQVAGDTNWIQADPNRPLTTGDNLWVDQNSRGEVHVGSTAIRLSSQTGVSFLTLDDRTVQLQLAQGTIEVHLRNLSSGDAFEIDTPNLAFTLSHAGEYRVQTDPDGNSTVIVIREGEGEVTGSGDSWVLRAGQQYTFNGTEQLSYDAMPEPGYDDFEDWCQSRDQRENGAASARYVSRDVDGYYDLDDYGDWESDPDYGNVWVPRAVAVGWAPYHVGHWVWIAPWGWTWVDEEPWGFAPFHYGRWCFVRSHWAWVPGPIVVRPVYAPALVGFVGGGGFGFSVTFGGGFAGVAWFPLGPRDVFVPGYRCSPRYVQVVNVTNTRVINVTQVTNMYNTVVINRDTTVINNYTYARNVTAVTAVSRETFVGARSVASASVRVTPDQIDRARVVDSEQIAPTRSSRVFASAKMSTVRPPVPIEQRAVVARLNPAVSRPAPVTTTNTNRGFGQAQGNQPTNPRGGFNNNAQPPARGNVAPPAAPANNNPQPQSRDGFHPFQPPPGGNNPNTGGNPSANTGGATGGTGNTPPANRDNGAFNRSGNRTTQTPPAQTQPAQTQPQQNEQRQSVRFTPPVKARDEMYDVHPPLNRKEAPAPPKQEEKRPAPPEKGKDQHDENKREH
ncbi:MAG TPA: DUF6600 domain-containing protein [Candidatus Acidoferrales bacterium]|nr:DUF6600 domain-containing protein [Candidatus Acidoferrales bacterium]